jgi:hypothetical protein
MDEQDFPENRFLIWMTIENENMVFIISRSGTVQIQGSSAERVYGNFTLTGEGFPWQIPKTSSMLLPLVHSMH